MANVYFDIETTGFNPKVDKVITIQLQEIDSSGKPRGQLVILKEWESSEKAILMDIHNQITGDDKWSFVPVGYNLIFDLSFLFERFKFHGLSVPMSLSHWFYDRPNIDIKHTLVMANQMNFKGSGLDQMTNKKTNGARVPEMYRMQDFEGIEEYVKQETESFLEVLQKLIKELPGIIKKTGNGGET